VKISRILSYTTRHLYLYKRSLPRLMEIFYWPLLDLLIWGFISTYLASFEGALPKFLGFLIGALILWDILFRSQQGLTISFLEDMWSRNLLNLFVSPLSVLEYICSLLVVSLVKLVFSSGMMIVLAWVLYSYNVFELGFYIIPLALNLIIMGWAIGIITTGIILRYGQEAEVLAWGIAFLFQPFSAVFYPVDILPPVVQTITKFIPSAHVFEGMRHVIEYGTFPMEHFLWAVVLNIIYLIAAVMFFYWNFKGVKKAGLLAKVGE
jgi:ABC-2 type transport system permease protein